MKREIKSIDEALNVTDNEIFYRGIDEHEEG